MQLAQCTDFPNSDIIGQIIGKVIDQKGAKLEEIISNKTTEACLRSRAVEKMDGEKP